MQRRRLHVSFNKEGIKLWQGDKPKALLNDQGRRLRALSRAIATGSRQEPEPGLRLLNESSIAKCPLIYLSAGQGVWDGGTVECVKTGQPDGLRVQVFDIRI